jgi:hypothetical protein
MIKHRKMRFAGHVAPVVEKINTYRVFFRETQKEGEIYNVDIGVWMIFKLILERCDGGYGLN